MRPRAPGSATCTRAAGRGWTAMARPAQQAAGVADQTLQALERSCTSARTHRQRSLCLACSRCRTPGLWLSRAARRQVWRRRRRRWSRWRGCRPSRRRSRSWRRARSATWPSRPSAPSSPASCRRPSRRASQDMAPSSYPMLQSLLIGVCRRARCRTAQPRLGTEPARRRCRRGHRLSGLPASPGVKAPRVPAVPRCRGAQRDVPARAEDS